MYQDFWHISPALLLNTETKVVIHFSSNIYLFCQVIPRHPSRRGPPSHSLTFSFFYTKFIKSFIVFSYFLVSVSFPGLAFSDHFLAVFFYFSLLYQFLQRWPCWFIGLIYSFFFYCSLYFPGHPHCSLPLLLYLFLNGIHICWIPFNLPFRTYCFPDVSALLISVFPCILLSTTYAFPNVVFCKFFFVFPVLENHQVQISNLIRFWSVFLIMQKWGVYKRQIWWGASYHKASPELYLLIHNFFYNAHHYSLRTSQIFVFLSPNTSVR